MNKSIKDHIIESLDNLVGEKLNRFKSKLCEGEDKFPKGKVDKYDSAELVDYMISCYTETHAAQKTIQILEAINQKDTAEKLKEKIQHGKIKKYLWLFSFSQCRANLCSFSLCLSLQAFMA